MTLRPLLLAAALCAAAAAQAEPASYAIEPTHTFVTFEVLHFGTSTSRGRFDRKEGMAYADSPTNLMWRLSNDFSKSSKAVVVEEPEDDGPSFSDFSLDFKQD